MRQVTVRHALAGSWRATSHKEETGGKSAKREWRCGRPVRSGGGSGTLGSFSQTTVRGSNATA